jgi:RNA polymerase sigma-70 factor (ECF subfamily)
MKRVHAPATSAPEGAVVAAARAGDERAFATLAERYRAELQVHCYRMLGSLQDAEDLVQETLLRAWTKRASFQGRSTFRAWLYGIATNACLDALRRRPRRVLPSQLFPPADPTAPLLPAADLPWLQPYPDRLLDGIAPTEEEPDAALVAKEGIELAFLAAIQHLPPRQRAVLILRDALDWSAEETASLLDTSTAAVNSALQRAHATLTRHLSARRLDWSSADSSEDERSLLERYMAAWEQADATAMAALLRDDARMVMPPTPSWFVGREAIATFIAHHALSPDWPGRMRTVAVRANRQPGAALYVLRPGAATYEAFALTVLRIEEGAIAEITLFRLPELFPAFGLPPTL